MINKTFFRWSAWSVLAGAVLLSMGYWLRPDIKRVYIDVFASQQGLISSLMVALGTLFLICGLPGVFARQGQLSGKGGLIASGLSFSGLAAFHLGTIALYFVLPVLINHNPETRALVDSDRPPFPRFAIFWAISLLVQSIGLAWMGMKTWRAELYPKPAAVLLILGSLLFLLAPVFSFETLKTANTLVMAGLCMKSIFILKENGNLVNHPFLTAG